ncbi:ABC transporter permease [Lacibacterium aquatile]|uniref:ABC transporter permease n=1 Tax=Lacibacterium aquatile TaxID=1168082 RepID=A0ABW5DMI8_9PROT
MKLSVAGGGWRAASLLIAGLALAPIVSLVVVALGGGADLWPHLLANVLPRALLETGQLLLGVGFLVAVLGTGLAWLVTAYDFPGRKLLEGALLLPLAVPTYIVAYAYLDLLHPIGPVQVFLRDLLGYDSPHDFRLPEIRSMGGCILVLGFVLYPYVYLPVRAMFLTQAAGLIEASRTLGVSRTGVFFKVALPLARPAIAAGMALALMETLNDIGASEFLGVRSLTISIYTTWVTRSDLPGAAQIALAMLLVVIALVSLERWARRHQRYAASSQRMRVMVPQRLPHTSGSLVLLLGLLPILIGFAAPASYLAVQAWRRVAFAGISPAIRVETLNTVMVSAIATVIVLAAGMAVAYAARLRPGPLSGVLGRVSALGYAVPGTVLAIGLLTPVTLVDRALVDVTRSWFGIAGGLLLLGSGAALVYAYAARFLAISTGGLEAGFSRIPLSLDQASRVLGKTAGGTLGRVHLPLSKPALAAAALLVFVDCMKELPASLLLRPLNFETLATHLYGEAARGTYEDAALAALIIVVIGVAPVILLARLGRQKSAS